MDSQLKSVEQRFLRAIAIELNLKGDSLAVFLVRFDPANATKINTVLVSFIEWNNQPVDTSQKLQDELARICQILEEVGCPIGQKKRGRVPKGQSPWDQAYKWLWEYRFPIWQQQQHQPSAKQEMLKVEVDSASTFNDYFQQGSYYEGNKEFARALEAFEESTKYAQKNDEIIEAFGAISRCLLNLNNPKAAINILNSKLNLFKDHKEIYKLYKHLADIYKALQEKELRAIALEKAIGYAKDNIALSLEIAYLYHEIGLYNLSLIHYLSLLALLPNESELLNMLGIQYERLRLTIFASRFYMKAAKMGLPIAASNLFYLYINTPISLSTFPEEVEQILEQHIKDGSAEPNVLRAFSDISEFKEKEREDELKHIQDAQKIKDFLLLFANSHFDKESLDIKDFIGLWYPEEKGKNLILEISGNELQIKAFVSVELDTRAFFIGQVNNQAAIITFSDKDKGYAYLSSDKQCLYVMRLDGYKPIFITFIRRLSEAT